MKPTGANMSNVKQINRSAVLQLLLTRGAMARSELAAELNLTSATLTSICGDFIQRGLLVESAKEETHLSGRKKCPLEINYSYKYIVTISLHYNGHMIAVTDLIGNPIAIEPIPADAQAEPEVFLKQIATACIRILWENHISSDRVLGAGVCIIGPVDQDHGIALDPFKLFHGKAVPVKELLEREFPFPVCVENNVCSFLTAETLFGQARGNNLMAIRWGPGVGSASCTNGILCKDHNYHSAEIGHTFFYHDSDLRCKCGRVGCLETGVGLSALSKTILTLAPSEPTLQRLLKEYGAPSIGNINCFITSGCEALMQAVGRCARDLAIGVSNAIQVFSPDQVVLYGVLFETDQTCAQFFRYIHDVSPQLDDSIFIKSTLDAKREYIGPVAIAVKRFLIENG